MRVAVVDTSALLRLFIPDGPVPAGLQGWIEQALRGDAVLWAPELLRAEVVGVLAKKERRGELSAADADAVLDLAMTLPIEYQASSALAAGSLRIARGQRITGYDAQFLALAERHRAVLITADGELGKAAERLGLATQ